MVLSLCTSSTFYLLHLLHLFSTFYLLILRKTLFSFFSIFSSFCSPGVFTQNCRGCARAASTPTRQSVHNRPRHDVERLPWLVTHSSEGCTRVSPVPQMMEDTVVPSLPLECCPLVGRWSVCSLECCHAVRYCPEFSPVRFPLAQSCSSECCLPLGSLELNVIVSVVSYSNCGFLHALSCSSCFPFLRPGQMFTWIREFGFCSLQLVLSSSADLFLPHFTSFTPCTLFTLVALFTPLTPFSFLFFSKKLFQILLSFFNFLLLVRTLCFCFVYLFYTYSLYLSPVYLFYWIFW